MESQPNRTVSVNKLALTETEIYSLLLEVLVENRAELLAVFLPIGGGRIVIQSGDPVGVQLVNARGNSVSLLQPSGEGPRDPRRTALRETRMGSQCLFETFQTRQIACPIEDRRSPSERNAVCPRRRCGSRWQDQDAAPARSSLPAIFRAPRFPEQALDRPVASQSRLRSLPFMLKRVRPRATPSLLAIGITYRQ